MDKEKKKKSDITKAYIYKGAISLFKKKGYEIVTIRDLSNELDISLGNLYYHFKGKDDILILYFKKLHESTVAGVAESIKSKKSVSSKVLSVIEINLGLLKESKSITRDLINATSNLSHPLSPFGEELKECQEGAIDLFRQAMSAEYKKGEYLDSVAFLYWFYYLGICLCWANDKSKNEINTQKFINLTFPLTRKLLLITRIGIGRSLLIKIANLLKQILLKWR